MTSPTSSTPTMLTLPPRSQAHQLTARQRRVETFAVAALLAMAGCGIAVLAIASNGNDGAGFLYAAGIFILGVVFGMVVYHFPYLEMQRDLNFAQWERDMWRARYYNLEKRLKHDPSRSVAWPTDGRIEVLERT